MRTLRALLVLTAVFLAAFVAVPTGAQPHDEFPCTFPDAGHIDDHHNVHQDHDHVALNDIHHYTEHHLTHATPVHDTFATHTTTHDWDIRSIDYHTTHGIVRVYHATSTHDDDVRFTTRQGDGHGPCHSWERVH